MRKITQIKKITSISPIAGADMIETATIGGWNVVVKKGEFNAGDSVLYFEIDSFLPESVKEFRFLTQKSSSTVTSPITGADTKGHILKTVKLRGQISQGLIMPIGFGLSESSAQDEVDEVFKNLGVFKWEAPIPEGGNILAPFPSWIRKTGCERAQNIDPTFFASLNPSDWFATEKIDGSSATFVKTDENELLICSRNWVLSPTSSSPHVRVANMLNLFNEMPSGSIIQGEIFGENIQNNPLKSDRVEFRVFNTVGIDTDTEFGVTVREMMVPELDLTLPDSIEGAIEQVYKMKSTINPNVQAEGAVWWNRNGVEFVELNGRSNFKAINNHYLLKSK